jgi:drug/metabolite transporter (DMT)-like permease
MASARRSQLILAFVAVSVIWGSTYFAIRVALESFPPFAIGAIRFLAAGGLLYAFLRARGERAPTPKQWGAAALTGGLFFVVSNGFVNVAEKSVSSGLASVLVATMPLWATVFSRIAGESSSAREWIGIALGFAGVVVLNLSGEIRASGTGAVFALIAPMAWALGSIVSKRVELPKGSMSTAAQMLAGGAMMTVVSFATGEKIAPSPTAGSIAAIAYLVVFGSLVGFSAYVFLLRHTRPTVATSYAYVNPVIAIALGVVFAGERLDLASGAGAAIVLLAVLLLTRSKARPAAPRETPAPAARPLGYDSSSWERSR